MNVFEKHAQPLRRPSLHEELAEKISELIDRGDLVPGEKVPEKELCEAFGVSRTPLREALKVLASNRLVSLEPNRGAWVTPITRSDVEEIFPIMGILEALGGELACARMTDEEIEDVRALHERLLEKYRAGDWEGFIANNRGIHAAIMAGSRNETLSVQFNSLASRVRQARYAVRMTDEQWERAVDEHEKMIACLEARDAEGLAKVLRGHLDHKAETVLAWLDAQQSAG